MPGPSRAIDEDNWTAFNPPFQLGAAGTAESLDLELNPDVGFTNTLLWNKDTGWVIAGGVATCTAGANALVYPITPTVTAYKLYKAVWTLATETAGSARVRAGSVYTASQPVPATYTQYITANTTDAFGILGSGPFSGTITYFSMKAVLSPSAIGTTILNAVGGAQNWATKGDHPDATSFTVTVTR